MKSKLQFSASQVQRVEEKTAADGHKYRNIFVKLTPEQREYLRRAREEVEAEFPPKKLPARPRLEMVVAPEETNLLEAVDLYAAKHDLPNRGAVLRVALSKLLKVELAIPHHGWKPGRARKPAKRRSSSRQRTLP